MTQPPTPVARAVAGPDGPWEAPLRDLAATGTALVHGAVTEWQEHARAAVRDAARRRALLDRDLDRHRRGSPGELRFAATRLLLKCFAASALGTAPETLEVGRALTGRIHLRGLHQVDLSLSHTGDRILVGLTTLGRIGVDIEAAGRRLSGSGVEQQMCTAAEAAELARLAGPARNEQLIRRWTLKEAYTKALGLGLYFPFAEFGFSADPERPRLLRADGAPVAGRGWSFHSIPVGPAHLGAVALHDRRPGTAWSPHSPPGGRSAAIACHLPDTEQP